MADNDRLETVIDTMAGNFPVQYRSMAREALQTLAVVVKGQPPIDRYILKPDGLPEEVFEGDNHHANAIARQGEYERDGVNSQMFREREVLLREPVRWVRGWEKPESPNTNSINTGS